MKEKALIDWVEQFMLQNRLFGDRALVGLSGGADSILLGLVLEGLKERGHFTSLRHLHVDHGLRSNSGEQAFALKEYAESRGWDFELVKITGQPPKGNLEAWARRARKDIFDQHLEKDELLYLGHHIDDSFEWYLRQTVGSSSSGHSHGIPLVNGPIRRPFHCLSKKQITKFVKELELPVQVDQSNESLDFQRNAISKLVKKPLLELFPKGLAHYAEHANHWAARAGLKRKQLDHYPINDIQLIQNYIGPGVTCLIQLSETGLPFRDWSFYKDQIVGLITSLSSKGRGELRQNLDKLFRADNGVRGPLSFSGGVKVYLYPGMLVFTDDGTNSSETLKGKNHFYDKTTQIPLGSISMQEAALKLENLGGAGIILYKDKSLFGLKSLKKDELYSGLLQRSLQESLSMRPLSQLYQKAAASNQLELEFIGCLFF